ncbi:hypothetical protein CSC2_08440 [Clostridium zeae]|uniref:Uncharacterized protein n=1 Tax=Clostridium zeae TaxID=2759022 RepID=A0ABQ1E736_9CLOT|nr:hypothetical protein [Clostridium zeae]GFZ30318.1 hypothetical protein CSC2_08440 [Clostridium zeae]
MDKEISCKNPSENNMQSYRERLNLNIDEKEKIVEKAMIFIHNNGTGNLL